MKHIGFATATLLAGLANTVSAIGVVGTAEGFASTATGGGTATPVYPTTTEELVSYLGDSEARVIVLDKTFDFTDTEGTKTSAGCLPFGTGSGCQKAINANDWCTGYETSAPSTTVTYYEAGYEGIIVASDKSIIGKGSSGVIKGKGLRIANGAKNVIIQNIAITDINPEYVWGGDAITIDDSDNVWIDHVTTSLIGRMHIVLGTASSGRVTISNCYINGDTTYSATCDGHTYWAILFDGSNDLVTLKNNYIYYTSGRSPKVTSNTLLHAVNNYWYENSGHAFEIDKGGYVLAEGNVFEEIPVVVQSPIEGQYFTVPSVTAGETCKTYLGRDCVVNSFSSSGTFSGDDTGFLSDFKGKNVPAATAASEVKAHVLANAGAGKLSQ